MGIRTSQETAASREGTEPRRDGPSFSGDFGRFWIGQTISACGTGIGIFALPLLVFSLTGSALNLGVTMAMVYLPYALVGLPIGAWVDRADRKRAMVAADLARSLLIASVPLAYFVGVLSVWWVYAVTFASSTCGIAFNAGRFAAVPFLVDKRDLVRANARLQASFSAASFAGPLLAGVALLVVPIASLLAVDACTFLISALSLGSIRRRFHTERTSGPATRLREDVWAGLEYVFRHPVLRNIALMAALVNVFLVNTTAQIVLLAKEELDASDSAIGWLYASGSAGVFLLAMLAPRAHRYLTFGQVAVGAILLHGVTTVVLSQAPNIYVAVVAWALVMGSATMFSVSTASLRQTIVPPELLGRVVTVALVLAWSIEPPAALAGGFLIESGFGVATAYAWAGVAVMLVAVAFWFGPVGHERRHLAADDAAGREEATSAGA